jgi:hypothetical protein
LILQLTSPTYTEVRYLLNKYVVDKEIILPSFVYKARYFLSTIIPGVKMQIDANRTRTGNLDNVVVSAIFYLNQFPDYLRHTRLKAESHNN